MAVETGWVFTTLSALAVAAGAADAAATTTGAQQADGQFTTLQLHVVRQQQLQLS